MQQVEILAPAGSVEGLKAAIYAGADAVYIGGQKFGARAFADNPDQSQLLEAIDFVHLYGKKIYLTTNTLVSDCELQGLYEMIAPLYEKGLDACIVQDVGALSFLHRAFPDLDLHASTQMTLQDGKSGEMLRPLGVTRIVPARELSIEELQTMRKDTTLEMEVFVHGALCYCYSGQCLMSSIIGGRSGNRGMCAQPCRLEYEIEGDKQYILSPKDVCTLDRIPELVDAGIDSFKIEGRMKKKEYAALNAFLYRKYVDFYINEGYEEYNRQRKQKDSALQKDILRSMDLFNRGGFCRGFIFEKDKKNIMYPQKNGHFGVCVGTVEKSSKRQASIRLNEKIHYQDVLEIRDRNQNSVYEYTVKNDADSGNVIQTNIKPGSPVRPGQNVYRRKNGQLLDEISSWNQKKIELQAVFEAHENEPLKLTVMSQGIISETAMGLAEHASKRAVQEEEVKKRLMRTGETNYQFHSIEVRMEPELFIPMGQINDLRREALKNWEEKFQSNLRRQRFSLPEHKSFEPEQGEELIVTVTNEEQLKEVLCFHEVTGCHINLADFSDFQAVSIVEEIHQSGKKAWVSFPLVFDEKYKMPEISADYLINSFRMLQYLQEHSVKGKRILEHNMYVTNHEAFATYHELFGCEDFTRTLDASISSPEEGFSIVYGKIPVMVSKGCVARTKGMCNGTSQQFEISTPKKDQFLVVTNCRYCYNTIYTKEPRVLEGIKRKKRFVFTDESKEQVGEILRKWIQ